MACNMLASKHLSNQYWAEVVENAIYILNICSTKSVRNKVPQEAWTRLNDNVEYLKVFGCYAYTKVFGCCTYTHVLDEMRKMLDKKEHKFVFVGYSEDTKAYKLYDRVARKVIINQDVQFMENDAWDGSVEKKFKIINAIVHDDIEEEEVQTPCTSQCTIPSISGIAMEITTENTLVRKVGAQSTPRAQQTLANSSISSTSPNPTLASLLQRKKRSMRDIYNEDATNSFCVFSLF
jgi:hypothetical protein